MSKKRVKKRLNIKRTLVVVILLYIVFCVVNYIFTSPIRHIEIIGNNIIKDKDIILRANLKDYPSIMKYSSKKIEKKIEEIELIENAKVKKKIGNVLSIEVSEKRVLFYYLNKDMIVLSDGSVLDNNLDNLYGIPILVNDVEENLLNKFVIDFNELKDNIIYEINEITHFPKYSEDVLINGERFKITMNDGNVVIVNVDTVSVLNKYNDIYSSLNGVKGTIDLDSNKINNLVFTPFEV